MICEALSREARTRGIPHDDKLKLQENAARNGNSRQKGTGKVAAVTSSRFKRKKVARGM